MEYLKNYGIAYKVTDPNDPSYRAALIKEIIEDHRLEDETAKGKWNRYRQAPGSLPIHQKTSISTTKANNKIAHDFRGEIVDLQTNYFVGIPISYNIDKDKAGDAQEERFRQFIDKNDFTSKDNDLAIRAGVAGSAGRLLYQQNKQFWVANLHRWEFKIIYDNTTGDPLFAIRYYEVQQTQSNRRYLQVEFYDNQFVEFYAETETGGFWLDEYNLELEQIDDTGRRQTKRLHGFTTVPIVEFENNPLKAGDFEKVEEIIDAYDKIASINIDDIQELKDAYLFIKGLQLTEKQKETFKERHLVDTLSEDADMKFVTKAVNPEYIKQTLQRFRNDIYRLSQTVNFADETFSGGSQSGESRKYKLMSMDNRRALKQSGFRKGLAMQFEVLSTGWLFLANIMIDPDWIYYDFTPNIPIDLLYWAEVAVKLKGILSDQTILDILPSTLVPDSVAELEQIAAEREAMLSRYTPLMLDEVDEEEEEDEA